MQLNLSEEVLFNKAKKVNAKRDILENYDPLFDLKQAHAYTQELRFPLCINDVFLFHLKCEF